MPQRGRSRSITQNIKHAISSNSIHQRLFINQQAVLSLAASMVMLSAVALFPDQLSAALTQLVVASVLVLSLVFQGGCVCYTAVNKWQTVVEFVSQWRHGELATARVF